MNQEDYIKIRVTRFWKTLIFLISFADFQLLTYYAHLQALTFEKRLNYEPLNQESHSLETMFVQVLTTKLCLGRI